MTALLVQGSAHALPLHDESVQCVVTSPPYWGLRAYEGEQIIPEWGSALGLEPTPELYVEHIVAVFREVRRVLRPDGTLWLNMGDSYAAQRGATTMPAESLAGGEHGQDLGDKSSRRGRSEGIQPHRDAQAIGLKHKDLIGIPWRVAFALQADGWWLRSDIVWSKPNPMPESVTDRPTKSHEYVFLMAKSEQYFYDADAIREMGAEPDRERSDRIGGATGHTVRHSPGAIIGASSSRNARSVWNIATAPYPGAHFATFPEKLAERCVLAGSSRQACAECGAPWARVVERGNSEHHHRAGCGHIDIDSDDFYDSGSYGGFTNTARPTGDWQPTCAHDAGSGRSVVLDPFAGTSVTGIAAIRNGRDYVGLDLSRSYLVEHSRERLRGVVTAVQEKMTL